MFTCEELKSHLKLISRIGSQTASVEVGFNNFSNEKYVGQVIIYSNYLNNNYVDRFAEEWINKFSLFTETLWVVARQSLQNSGIYTKIYKCYAARHTCKSKIVFKVTSHIPGRIPKITITINYLKCKCVAPEKLTVEENTVCNEEPSSIQLLFYKYFYDSYKPVTAKMYHNLSVLVNESEQIVNPTMSEVMIFWHAWRLKIAEKCLNVNKFINIKKTMKQKVSEIESMGVLIRRIYPETVILITQTMKRVLAYHKLDVVIISSVFVPQGLQVTMFFVPNNIGALCFACILHQKRTTEAYKNIFLHIKGLIENDFKRTFNPHSIVIPNLQDHILLASKAVFEDSKVTISPWSICRDLWRQMYISTTSDAAHHKTIAAFHDIMHAADAKSAHLRFIKFTTSTEFPTLPKQLQKHLEEIWNKTRLIVWWSNDNNSLVELSITLLEQLIITKCESFNIVNMCDVICTLDTHFQELMMGWISKKSIFKTYVKFLQKLSPNIREWTINMTRPHQFLLTKGHTQIYLRTDSWLCSCSSGKKALYCDHLGAIMEFVDVAVPLADEERDLLKLIAGENNALTKYSECNPHVNNLYSLNSDGNFKFHLPIENITYYSKIYDQGSGDIINCVSENLKNTTQVHNVNVNLFANSAPKKNVNSETKTVQQGEVGDGVDTDLHKTIKKEKPFHVNHEPMEIQNTDTPNFVSVRKEIMDSTDETSTYKNDDKTEMEVFVEIDLKNEMTQDNDENMTETGMQNLGNNNLLEEYMSQDYEVAANNFEAEYKNAVSKLCSEFQSLDDCLSQSPSASKLASILHLTNLLTRASVELQDIKHEIDDSD